MRWQKRFCRLRFRIIFVIIDDLIDSQIIGVYFVYGNHHIGKMREALFATIIFIDNTCTGGGNTALSFLFAR